MKGSPGDVLSSGDICHLPSGPDPECRGVGLSLQVSKETFHAEPEIKILILEVQSWKPEVSKQKCNGPFIWRGSQPSLNQHRQPGRLAFRNTQTNMRLVQGKVAMTTQGPGGLVAFEALPTCMCTHHMLIPTLQGPRLSEPQTLGPVVRRECVALQLHLSTQQSELRASGSHSRI